MRYLRVSVIGLFVLSLIIYAVASLRYSIDKDTTPPEIRCESTELELSVSAGPEALMQGLTAYDEEDGDLTENIMVASTSNFLEPGAIKVKYVVFDSHNNSATLTRWVRYSDYTPPRFALSRPLVFKRGENIRYLNYVTAYDVIDGDITERIKIKSSYVSNYTAGNYLVVLEVSNSYGDTSEAELLVVVTDEKADTVNISLNDYIVYVPQGGQFDPYSNISSVTDQNGKTLDKDDVDVMGGIDTEIPGCYQLVYVYEGKKNVGRTFVTVIVRGKE